MSSSHVFTVQQGGKVTTIANSGTLPQPLQPKRGVWLPCVYPSRESLENKEGKRSRFVDDWGKVPTGTWFLFGRDKQIWSVEIASKDQIDQPFVVACRKAFSGDRYNRVNTFMKMKDEYKAKFRRLPLEIQIELLQPPHKQVNKIKDGNLDEYIKKYGLSKEERDAAKAETNRKIVEAAREKATKIERLQIAARDTGGSNRVYGATVNDRPVSRYALKSIGVTVKQGDRRNIEEALVVIVQKKTTFPAPILRLVYHMYLMIVTHEWLKDGTSLSRDRRETFHDFEDLVSLRRICPALYIETIYRYYHRSIMRVCDPEFWGSIPKNHIIIPGWSENPTTMKMVALHRPELLIQYRAHHRFGWHEPGTCDCCELVVSKNEEK